MNFKAVDVISKMNDISNMKYLENLNFSDQRKNWSFFVSNSILIILKRASKEHLNIHGPINNYDTEILGYKVFGVNGLNDDIIYFAEKYKIKEE